MVSIGETDAELKKRFDKFNLVYYNYFEHPLKKARSTLFDTGQTIIRFRSPESVDHDTISHEVFHAVTHLLDFIGMPLNLDHNDEAYAYLVGYLTKSIYEKIKTKNK